jgi:hypothetical protein
MARSLVVSSAVGGAAVFALFAACSSSLPTPKTGPHPPKITSYIEVPFPPPAAHVEVVPSKPRDGAVWMDGEWDWEGKNWVWETGGWIMPPGNAYLAPWITYRQGNGKLLFAPGSWLTNDGKVMPKPAVLVSAESSLEAVAEAAEAGAAAPVANAPPSTLGDAGSGSVPEPGTPITAVDGGDAGAD